MSLIINGMKMPNGCYDCPILQSSDGCFDFECPFNSYLLWHNAEDVIRYRPDNCPMTELPAPHGRLIDADALRKKIESIYGGALWTFDCFECIRKAPTVIEAEVSE